MIVDFDALEGLRGNVTMVDGGFDPLHAGHVAYFRIAAGHGLPVLCNVAPDAYVGSKHRVLLPQALRCEVIDELRSIAYVHAASRPTAAILEQARPARFVKGLGWQGRLPAEELAICARHGIEIAYADAERDSSSRRVQALGDTGAALARFERLVAEQRPVDAAHYEAEYFHGQWRSDTGGNYTIAERRRLEGRNPELIRDTFAARTVLDFGCGPGALMFLLQELGVEADGVDFAPASRDLAPPEVQGRIRIAGVDAPGIPAGSYELVICREVLEHLTVLQVQKAVENMCAITSRYVYVTTRFHPAPADLLDVTTEFDVDPTHITLLGKDLLRTMFVLQGMRRRADLEARMDWLGKNRVLVYEKPQG